MRREVAIINDIRELRSLRPEMTTAKFGDTLTFGNRIFERHTNPDGSKGGFVEKTARVGEHVYVGIGALVLDKAEVYGKARIFGEATVSGNAKVFDNAEVSGGAKVYGNGYVFGNASVSGDAQVYGFAKALGNSKLYGTTQISGWTTVHGDVVLENEILCTRKDFGNNPDVALLLRMERSFDLVRAKRQAAAGPISEERQN